MLQINPKKFKHIKNKTIPSPLRPKFRNKNETNIYFLSQRKVKKEKKETLLKKTKLILSLAILLVGGYITNFINFTNKSSFFMNRNNTYS